MKICQKKIWFIALVALIGLGMAACGGTGSPGTGSLGTGITSPGNGNDNGYTNGNGNGNDNGNDNGNGVITVSAITDNDFLGEWNDFQGNWFLTIYSDRLIIKDDIPDRGFTFTFGSGKFWKDNAHKYYNFSGTISNLTGPWGILENGPNQEIEIRYEYIDFFDLQLLYPDDPPMWRVIQFKR